MKVVYVVAIKRLKDRSSNDSEHWEYGYTDQSGYHFWSEYVDDADTFWDIESAEKWFNQNKFDLFEATKILRRKYDLSSVCIRKVSFVEPICETKKSLTFEGYKNEEI